MLVFFLSQSGCKLEICIYNKEFQSLKQTQSIFFKKIKLNFKNQN